MKSVKQGDGLCQMSTGIQQERLPLPCVSVLSGFQWLLLFLLSTSICLELANQSLILHPNPSHTEKLAPF